MAETKRYGLGEEAATSNESKPLLFDDPIFPAGSGFSKPLSKLTPSFLVFDSKHRLIFWSIRPEDDCDIFEKLLLPGLDIEGLSKRALKENVWDPDGFPAEQCLSDRLERFYSGNSSFQCRLAGDRWFQFSDKRGSDGTTLTTIVNVTSVERRERALALLVGETADGLSIFERAARALSIGLGFKTASVARLLPGGNLVQTMACWHENEIISPLTFPIKGTPCEPVYQEGYFSFIGDFHEKFPELKNIPTYFDTIRHGSYVGQVVFDRSGVAIGHVLAIDETERTLDDGDRRLIWLVAEHVGFEIERKAVKLALEEGEQRFKDFAEAASDLFFELDENLKCSYVSGRAETVTGIKASDWIGRPIASLGSSNDPAWTHYLEDLAERRSFRDVFFMLTVPNGHSGYFSLNGKPRFNENDVFIGYRLTAREITNNVKAEGRAREAELRVRQVLEGSLEGFALYDEDHRLVLCNHKFLNLLFPGEEDKILRGMTVKQLADLWLKQSSKEDKRRIIKFHVESNSLGSDHQDITLPNGRTLRIIRRRTEEGGVATIYLDITDLKLRESELSEAKETAEFANRTKSRFLANVSHELRTPLNAIIGFSEIMRDQLMGPIDNPRYREYIEDIRSSGAHLLDMINDILDLSKAEAGRLELYDELIDVPRAINAVIRLMQERADQGKITLKTAIDPDLVLNCDPKRVKQILINLLSNAVKFTPEKGVVEIIAKRDNNGLAITITDTGIGIPADEIERVLSPFGQVDSPIARQNQGTGLGLPLTKRLIELHGGTLHIASKVGEGTQVTAYFPDKRVTPLRSEL